MLALLVKRRRLDDSQEVFLADSGAAPIDVVGNPAVWIVDRQGLGCQRFAEAGQAPLILLEHLPKSFLDFAIAVKQVMQGLSQFLGPGLSRVAQKTHQVRLVPRV